MKRILSLITALALAFTFSMCTSGTEQIPGKSYWKVTKMYYNNTEMALPAEQTSEMFFINNMDISGLCGCNNFFASYWAVAEKGSINIEPKMRTRKMCPDMNYEENFIDNLSKAAKYKLNGEKMTIKDKDNNTLFELERTEINRDQF